MKKLSPSNISRPGILYVIATPIGNLSDFSQRACETLKNIHAIICEDTRKTTTLLRHFNIERKTLLVANEHSEQKIITPVIQKLSQGLDMALLSDAGTPCVCDPGYELIQAVVKEQFQVSPIPGPCILSALLSVSGLPGLPLQFIGFLPKTQGKKRKKLLNLRNFQGTFVFFESPFRIRKTLTMLGEIFQDQPVLLGRELTKLHETLYRASASQLSTLDIPEKGEFTCLVSNHMKKNTHCNKTTQPDCV